MASKKKPIKAVAKKAAKNNVVKKSAAKAASAKKSSAKKEAAPAKKATAKKGGAVKAIAKKVLAKLAPKVAAKKPATAAAGAPAKSAAKTPAKSASAKGPLKELLTPLDDRVLIEPAGTSEKTAGGLFIPAMAQERPLQGKVLAVGKGARSKKGKLRPLDVQVGDEVLYAQFSGTQIQLSGRDVVLLKETEILGIINQ